MQYVSIGRNVSKDHIVLSQDEYQRLMFEFISNGRGGLM